MPSPNITETESLTHAVQATAPASGSGSKTVSVAGIRINQTGNRVACGIQNATTAAAIINILALGGGVLGRYAIKNLDGTNNLSVLPSTTGQPFDTLLPGEMTMGRFDAGVTAPAVQSSAGTVLMEYIICEA